MNQGDLLFLGIFLVGLGAAFWFGFRILLQALPARQPGVLSASPAESSPWPEGSAEIGLLIQPGGKLAKFTVPVRDFFRLDPKDSPDLERLARSVRPAEKFLNLCALPGSEVFSVAGREVQGISYRIPAERGQAILVSLRPVQPEWDQAGEQSGLAGGELRKAAEWMNTAAHSLDLVTALRAVHEGLENTLRVDWIETTLWSEKTARLTAYRLVGVQGGERHLEAETGRYQLGEGFAGQLAEERKALLVENLALRPELRPASARGAEVLQALAGAAMLAEGELIGTLTVGSLALNGLTRQDLELVEMAARSAGLALRNAQRFQEEQRRATELSSLAQVAQGFSMVRDPNSLYARLVQSILPLIKVDVLGFLIYNETTRTLEGQEPIFGLPSQFVGLYKVPIPANSLAEQKLLNQDVLLTENAAEAADWAVLGLSSLAQAASLRDTLLVPLTTGGRMLGYLQASNHSDGVAGFNEDEVRLLTIVANQAAPVIENATLVIQARQRAQRAEALRRIASLASSTAALEEILKVALGELSRLLSADMAFIFLLDSQQGMLRMHQGSMFGRPQSFPGLAFSIAAEDAQYPFTVTGSQRGLLARNVNDEKTIIPFYQQLLQAWQVVSVVAAPLVVRDAGIGEIWLCSRQAGLFDQGDLQVVATAAGQLASVVEQSSLRLQTDESLRQRVDQLTTLTRVSRELSLPRELKPLLDMLYDETLHLTGADCGSILLLNWSGPEQREPVTLMQVGDAVPTSLSDEQRLALLQGEYILNLDLERDGLPAPHAGIRSSLMVPIRYQNRPAGVIELHSQQAGAFSQDEVNIVLSLAAQAGVALENAALYKDQQQQETMLERNLGLMSQLYELAQVGLSNRPMAEMLAEIARAIQVSSGFQEVILSLYESEPDALVRVVELGLDRSAGRESQTKPQSWQNVQGLLKPEYRRGSVYFIPTEKRAELADHLAAGTAIVAEPVPVPDAWKASDVLLAPLYDSQQQPIGMLNLDAPKNSQRPSAAVFDALELLCALASRLIDTRKQINLREKRLMQLDADISRLKIGAEQPQKQIPLLLRRDLEQTLAIQATHRQMERVQAGLEMSEQAARQADALAALRTLAREMLTHFDMQVALVAEGRGAEIRLLDVIGSMAAQANPEALFGQRNPLRQVLQDGRLYLVADIAQDKEWQGTPLLAGLGAKSFIALPVITGQERRGGVLAIGQHALTPFSDADQQIYAQLSRQVGLGIQNLELLSQARRRLREMDLLLTFSQKLGQMDPDGILGSLLDTIMEVLSNGEAGWVGLWQAAEQTLSPRVARGYSRPEHMLSIRFAAGGQRTHELLPLKALLSGQPERRDVAFAQDYALPPEELLLYRKATGGRLPVSSLVVPLRRGEQPVGVVVIDQMSLSNAFTAEEEALAVALAQQAALAMENARLFHSAEQRAEQLQALNQVASTLSSSLQRGELIAALLGQLQKILPFETATLWLRQENTLTVAAAQGFSDSERRVGISVQVQESALFQEMVASGKPVLVPDVRQDARFPSLLAPDHLTWLGIPLLAKAELMGALALEKHEAAYYTADHLQMASTFASQAGVALENARLFEDSSQRAAELSQRSQRLALLNRLSAELSATLDGQTILRLTCRQLGEALGADCVGAVLVEGEGKLSLQAEEPAGPQPLPLAMPSAGLFEHLSASEGIFSTANLAAEGELLQLAKAYFNQREIVALLVVPLITAVNLHGWLLIQSKTEQRYTSPEIELARTMANQAAVAIQNARLYDETHRLTQDLEKRVEERTGDFRREHNNIQALLRINSELSASLDLEQIMTRTLGVVNEAIGSEQCLVMLNQGKTYEAGVGLVTLALDGDLSYGTANLVMGSPERDISRFVIRRKEPVLVENLAADARWKGLLDNTIPFSSALCVPLLLGEEVMGAMLLLHRKASAFNSGQVSLVEAIARQFSITLNNAELYNLIRDQAQNLGGLLREQQMEASRSRAILESVADGVLVTDASMTITLLNASAQKILGIEANQIVGDSLETLMGRFGKSGQVWWETIQRWSRSPGGFETQVTHAEQITLDNGRIVAVNLAPVFFRDQFLATVSIFRDITHEVQVDRLKSEFVANVSHELRTPLTSIKGYVEIMLMGAAGPINPQQGHFLEIVKNNTERLNILVNDLLNVSQIDAGRVNISVEPIDLREISLEVLAESLRKSRLDNKPMEFLTDIPESLPQVLGDPKRIRQVIANLVNNAYFYTPADGRVVVRIRPMENEVQVDVQDNGIGIEAKNQERIFERFYRGEDPLVLATAGTGLGLAISKIVVEMHQGRIWFTSSGVRGEGSTFSFTLPVKQAEE